MGARAGPDPRGARPTRSPGRCPGGLLRPGHPIRILSVGNRYPPWSLGGYETIWQRANAALRRGGHQVRVLTAAPDPTDEQASETAEPDVHRELRWYWSQHRFPAVTLRAALALERANARTLREHVETFAPDAVVWWSMGGMSLSLLEQVRRADLPALGVVGDEWMLYGPEVDGWSRRWRGWRRPAGPLARLATGIPARFEIAEAARWIFISEHLLGLAQGAGRPWKNALVAHPGVDGNRFAWTEAQPWRWGLLYCGRIDARKGVETAVRALSHLPEQATLCVDGGGDEEYAAELLKLALQLGVERRLLLRRSPRELVPATYAEFDAVLFPVTWQEPWGLVPLEAMSVGRPVVASRAGGGPSEYLREDHNCLAFDPGDAAGLAAAVRRLAADPSLRAGLVAAGRTTTRRFSETRFHDTIEAELRGLAGARQPLGPDRNS
ncbi:MAG: glycosyltransferase family 4 protein [Solirubrobacteraceae bacterium]